MKRKLQQSEKRHKNVNLGDTTNLWKKSHKKWQISEKISQKVANKWKKWQTNVKRNTN